MTGLSPDPGPKSKIGEIIIMNTKTTTVRMLVAAIATFGLFQLPQSTSAQSARGLFRGNSSQQGSSQSPSSNCKTIQGSSLQVFDPVTGVVSGPVTNAGILNGTIEDVINFGAGFAVTPDPTVFAYTTDFTISTIHGQLRANPVTIQSGVTGAGAEWGHLNGDTSTGVFAGATGTITLNFKPVGDPAVGPYEAEFSAEICFAQ